MLYWFVQQQRPACLKIHMIMSRLQCFDIYIFVFYLSFTVNGNRLFVKYVYVAKNTIVVIEKRTGS